jgi:HK97 family phage portal protein
MLGNIAAALDRKASGSTTLGPIEEMWSGLWGRQSNAGVSVTWDSALRVSTVHGCVMRIAEGTSTVPVKLRQKRPGDRDARHAVEHPLNRLIETAPNDHQDSLGFREQVTIHTALTGNAYVWINRVRGAIAELIPFQPGEFVRLDRSNPAEWVYHFRLEGAGPVALPQREVWHLRGPAWKSWEGMEAARVYREAIGLSIAAEETQARLHSNGAQPGGLLSFEGKLSPEAIDRLKSRAADGMEGLRNAFRTLVLDNNATWTPFQMKGVDNQHLETRRFQVEEICRNFGVLPIMVGHADKAATYASAEQMFLAHVVHTVRPWHRRLEYSMDHQLLSREEIDEGYYIRFIDTELLRGDHAARAAYYREGIAAGWMLPEEPRGFEDMTFVAGLDRPRIPLNTGIVAEDGSIVTASAPAPATAKE